MDGLGEAVIGEVGKLTEEDSIARASGENQNTTHTCTITGRLEELVLQDAFVRDIIRERGFVTSRVSGSTGANSLDCI